MKKFYLLSILKCLFTVCLFIVAIPFLLNFFVSFLNAHTHIRCEWKISWSDWCDIVAVVIPSVLTWVVIKQSEEQQRVNEKNQDRMEHINQRMLDLERRAHFGYLIPELNDSRIKKELGRTVRYHHDLRSFVSLTNIGDDDIFILFSEIRVNGGRIQNPVKIPLYIAKQPPFNIFNVNLQLDDYDLAKNQIDVEIEIHMKNTKGYVYSQILFIGFENENGDGIINKFNISIEELDDNAN